MNSLVNILHFSVFGKSGSSTDPISGLFYFFYSKHFFFNFEFKYNFEPESEYLVKPSRETLVVSLWLD